jgi:hypothetical protein
MRLWWVIEMKIETPSQRTARRNKEAQQAERSAKKELGEIAVIYNEKPKDDFKDHTPLYRHRSS